MDFPWCVSLGVVLDLRRRLTSWWTAAGWRLRRVGVPRDGLRRFAGSMAFCPPTHIASKLGETDCSPSVRSACSKVFCPPTRVLSARGARRRSGGGRTAALTSREHTRDCRHGRTTSLRRRGLGTCACRTSCAGDPCAGVLRARGCRGFAPECRPDTALFARRAALAVELLVKAGGSTLSPSGEDQPTCVLFLFATCGAALFPRLRYDSFWLPTG